jgi:hypothetical protein
MNTGQRPFPTLLCWELRDEVTGVLEPVRVVVDGDGTAVAFGFKTGLWNRLRFDSDQVMTDEGKLVVEACVRQMRAQSVEQERS